MMTVNYYPPFFDGGGWTASLPLTRESGMGLNQGLMRLSLLSAGAMAPLSALLDGMSRFVPNKLRRFLRRIADIQTP